MYIFDDDDVNKNALGAVSTRFQKFTRHRNYNEDVTCTKDGVIRSSPDIKIGTSLLSTCSEGESNVISLMTDRQLSASAF